MSKLVRATDPTTGAEFTTSEAYANRKRLKITDRPAVDQHGRVIRTKQRINLSSDATRADLEQAAREAGVDHQTIKTAKTKADLAAAIETASTDHTTEEA